MKRGYKMSELFPAPDKKTNYKVADEVALQTIEDIEEEFGELTFEQKTVFIDSIKRGNLSFSKSNCALEYKLEKKAGEISEISIPELNTSQLREISKGDIIKANQKGEMSIALKDQQIQRVVRFLHIVCNCKLMDIDKIKKRDLGVIIMLVDFLG